MILAILRLFRPPPPLSYEERGGLFEQCGFWLSYWRLYAVVFGVPLVSGRNHMNAFDLEAGVVVTQSPSVRALFRTDSASSAAVLVSVYSDWEIQALKAELSNRGLPTCREKAVAIRRLGASDRTKREKEEADSVPALNLNSVDVVQLNLTFAEAETDRCLAEGFSWSHIVHLGFSALIWKTVPVCCRCFGELHRVLFCGLS